MFVSILPLYQDIHSKPLDEDGNFFKPLLGRLNPRSTIVEMQQKLAQSLRRIQLNTGGSNCFCWATCVLKMGWHCISFHVNMDRLIIARWKG